MKKIKKKLISHPNSHGPVGMINEIVQWNISTAPCLFIHLHAFDSLLMTSNESHSTTFSMSYRHSFIWLGIKCVLKWELFSTLNTAIHWCSAHFQCGYSWQYIYFRCLSFDCEIRNANMLNVIMDVIKFVQFLFRATFELWNRVGRIPKSNVLHSVALNRNWNVHFLIFPFGNIQFTVNNSQTPKDDDNWSFIYSNVN